MQEEIHINAKGNIIDILKQMKAGFESNSKSVASFQQTAAGSLDKITGSLRNINLASLNQNIQNLGQGFQDLNGPGVAFNTSMADLQAITGLTGKALDEIGNSARDNAKIFGGNAAQSLDSYKLLLSQLTPELANKPEILDKMATNVSVLSKTMGGDTTAATEVLTTAMNQYGVSMEDPKKALQEMTDMMNTMSAAAKEGSAELPTIKQAVENVGGQAKLSGMKFNEMNSAIQFLDKAGKKGAEGGTALRSILTKLGQGRFLPEKTASELKEAGVDVSALADKNVSFTDKMRMLQPVLEKDTELINTLFGEYGQAAAALIESADAQDQMTKAITGTNTSQVQAEAVMESTAEKTKRMEARIADAKIAFFEMTGGMTAYLGPATDVLRTMTSFTPIFSAARTVVMTLATAKGREMLMEKAATAARVIGAVATKAVTAAQWLWNAAMTANPIGLVIVAVAALAAGVYALSSALSTETAAEQMNADVKQRVIDKTADQRAQLDMLFTTLKSAKKGSDEYNQTLEDLEKMQPGIVDKYNLQAGAIEDINKAQKEMIENIDAIAQAEAWKELATESYKESFKNKAQGPSAFEKFAYGDAAAKTLNEQESKNLKQQAQYANFMGMKSRQTDEYKRAMGINGKTTDDGSEETPPETDTGTTKNLGTTDGYSGGNKSSSSGSGSGTVKSINVQIAQLMSGDIIINAASVQEGAAQLKQKVTEALVGAVRDFEVAM